MAQKYEVIQGFTTEKGLGRYDYNYLHNAPDIDKKIDDALQEFVPPVDTSLQNAGQSADSAATGKAIEQSLKDAKQYTDDQINSLEPPFILDKTLTQDGQVADAAAVGQAIEDIDEKLVDVIYADDEEAEDGVNLVDADTLGGEFPENFARVSQVQLLDEVVSERLASEFFNQEYIKENYATRNYVDATIDDKIVELSQGTTIELQGYATKDYVDNNIETKAAPAGYGLGDLINYKCANDSDIDNALISVINSLPDRHSFKRIVLSFTTTTNFSNGGGHYYADIFKLSTNYAIVTIKSYISGGRTMQRIWFEGELKPWEWVNPYMTPGVEYRTTERFGGEPVYTTLINVGETAVGGISTTTSISCRYIVRVGGRCGGYALPFINGTLDNEYSVWATAYNSSGKIKVAVECGRSTINNTALVQVWYTKV